MAETPSPESLAKDLSHEDATRGLVLGNNVYDPLIFSPKVVKFSARQYVFLHAYRLGVSVSEAASKAELSLEAVDRFLKKPETIEWLQDRALKDHIRQEWEEPSRWWAEMDKLYQEEDVPKHKLEILREFGDRVVPKVSRNADKPTSNIQINIDPTAVQEAFRRQQSIEAQIVSHSGDQA